jgi:hypothetical protein
MPKSIESMPQHEVLLRLRYAIDTARKYPRPENIESAVSLANDHPNALRSGHLKHNLGVERWRWLEENGVYPIGEPHEMAGVPAIKGAITRPEVIK